jgi:hypothetical protein
MRRKRQVHMIGIRDSLEPDLMQVPASDTEVPAGCFHAAGRDET